ncbi:MAG: hypothetical protein Q8O67_03230 [Deltaproteobacteria bacterium]|nr:hypothetical protein [Deltaproteobacteria bacterium]
MSVIARGTSHVITPRTQAGPAHSASTIASEPRQRDSDTFEVARRHASTTGAAGSLRTAIAVDDHASGAYFHKIVSPRRSDAHGIRVEGQLPEVMLDPRRFAVGGVVAGDPIAATKRVLENEPTLDAALTRLNDWRTGPLDKPSVYLGGRAGGQEADVGVSFDRVYDPAGRAVFTDLANGSDGRDPAHRFVFDGPSRSLKDGSGVVVAAGDAAVKQFMIDHKLQPSFAFRPYWRASPSEPGTQNWNNPPLSPEKAADWATKFNHVGAPPTNAYFYPGERFAMNVREAGRGQLRLDIRGAGVDANIPSFGVGIRASQFGAGRATEWKRVSSIDQKGNEGGRVTPTSSMAIGMVWEKSEVLLGAARTPTALSALSPVQVRGHDLADSAIYDRTFNVDVVGTREIVTIRP